MSKRILFLISDTGGGHRSSAQAITEAIHFLHPNQYETVIEDVWKNHTPHPFREIPRAYRWVVGPGLPVWKLMWHTMSQPALQRRILEDVKYLVKDDMQAYFRTMRPDMVVSVHPLLNHIGLSCLRDIGYTVPFATVITDLFTFHPTWVDPRVDHCIVPTEAARVQAIELGMAPEKIAVYGQPVSIKFTQPVKDKMTLRNSLGLDAQRPAILLVGGGEGSGPLVAIARQIAQRAPGTQLLVVAGRNHSLRQELETASWAQTPHVHIYGFVDNMPDLMHACDLIVTKAGPGTISEALIAHLPIILFDFIPGQETGNVDYVERNGVGVLAQSPQEIARIVASWTRPGTNKLAQFRANAERLARPRASLLIAEDLCHLVEHGIGLSRVATGQSTSRHTGAANQANSYPNIESVREDA
ncbi:MAG: glycosyltransferase [Caldilineaceae bacterium]|nr:glycosyltransferase [Caldilineaceae bacterium]